MTTTTTSRGRPTTTTPTTSTLLPLGLDCCVSYDEPMILTLSGTLSTTVKNLIPVVVNNRRENILSSLTENILVVKIVLTNRKLILIGTTTHDIMTQSACFYIDFSNVQTMTYKSKLFINTSSITLFELTTSGRCTKGTLKYNGDFDVWIKIRGMNDDLFKLIEGMRHHSSDFLSLISNDLLKTFWGATSTTTWACRICRLRSELVRLCFISEGIIIVSPSPDGGGYVTDVLHFNRMLFTFRRLHGGREIDLELFYVKSSKHVESILLRFFNEADHNISCDWCPARLFLAQKNRKFIEHITTLWINGKVGNYSYLSFLNTLGGRSKNDFTTYPVFPWTLSHQFKTPKIIAEQIKKKKSKIIFNPQIRDLSKPMGAQDQNYLAELLEKQKYLSQEISYLYGSHYSNAAYVSHLMIRKYFECNMLIHGGHVDLQSRSFNDIRLAWNRSMKENNCFMELVPEFYENDSELLSSSSADDLRDDGGGFGIIPQVNVACESPFTECLCEGGKCLCDPHWLNNDQLWFLFCQRLALESPQVSETLHNWIDLIFGCKQKGESSIREHNLFHPSSYLASNLGQHLIPGTTIPGGGRGDTTTTTTTTSTTHHSKDTTTFDDALITQALEFGQCPLQIFTTPHPARQNNGLLWETTSPDGVKEFTAQSLYNLYIGFCSQAPTCPPLLETTSWLEFLVKHPRSFPPVARIPSVLYCSTKDHVIIRYKETDPRIWSGLSSTPCLTTILTTTTDPSKLGGGVGGGGVGTSERGGFGGTSSGSGGGVLTPKPLEERQREVAHKDLICRYSRNGRYKVFTCLGSTDVYETNVNHKITTAAWDAHRHLYLGTREGEIIVGGVGSHYSSEEETFAPVPTVLTAKRTAHRGAISALRCRRDRLVSGCVRECVCVWDVTTTQEPIVQAEGWHNSQITALDIIDSVIVYSADLAGVLAIHDLRAPPWRSEVFPPQKFEADWFINSITRPTPTSAILQLTLSDSLNEGLTNKAVLNMDLNTCKSFNPLLFGTKTHVCLNGNKVKGVVLSQTPCGPLSLEGSDTILAVREKELACYKDSKIIKTWELPVPGNSITSLHAFPILTDSTDESGCSILTPFIRAYSSSYDHTTIIC